MAEQELAPVEGLDPNAPPDEDAGEPITIEALAAEKGWVPQDQWRDDPEKWRPAEEFIRVGLDSSSSMSRELKRVREEVSRVARTSADLTDRIVSRATAERDAYWQGQQAKGVADEDPALVERATQERIKLASEARPAAPQPPPELGDFQERNAWFGQDRLATARARQIAETLAKDGVQQGEQLPLVEQQIKIEFPHLFKAPAKTPASVQTSGARPGGSSRREKGFADMPAESQAMAKDYQKRHGIKPDDFAASYWADQAKQRRVG